MLHDGGFVGCVGWVVSVIAAIDPGTRSMSIAFLDGHGFLLGVQCFKAKSLEDMIKRLWCAAHVYTPDQVIAELPQHYGHESKTNPQGLIALSTVLGAALGLYCADDLTLVHPRDWKGSVDKKIHHERLLASLTPAELAIIGRDIKSKAKVREELDSVALAKWFFEREKIKNAR